MIEFKKRRSASPVYATVSEDLKHSQSGGNHLELVFLWPGSMTTFQPQVRENHLVASKLDSHLLSCCLCFDVYDTMYVLISLIRTDTCSGCFVYSVMLLL